MSNKPKTKNVTAEILEGKNISEDYGNEDYFNESWTTALSDLDKFWKDENTVKTLMECFCYCVSNNKPVPKGILDFFQDGFSKYLRGEAKLEAALMLKGKKGKPKLIPPDKYPFAPDYIESMLNYILKGYAKDKAVQAVVNDWKGKGEKISDTTLYDHFAIYGSNALSTLATFNMYGDRDFSAAEKEQINKYFNTDGSPK
jgi:hypothetical protein